MDQPRTKETFRDFLDRREEELAERVYALRTELGPLENELSEIRRTRTALGLPRILCVDRLLDDAKTPSTPDHEKTQNGTSQLLQRVVQEEVSADEATIKELIVRALLSAFPSGAMPAEIGDYICKAYKRQIDPGSLRPNLVRLREAGVVMHDGLASRWIIEPGTLAVLHALYAETPMMKAAVELAWRDEHPEKSSPGRPM